MNEFRRVFKELLLIAVAVITAYVLLAYQYEITLFQPLTSTEHEIAKVLGALLLFGMFIYASLEIMKKLIGAAQVLLSLLLITFFFISIVTLALLILH